MDKEKEWYVSEIGRLQERLSELDPEDEDYKTVAEALKEIERQYLEAEKVDNAYIIDSWRQTREDKAAVRDYIKLGVQTGSGILVALITVFAEETRAVTSKIGNVLGNLFRFNK